MSAFYILSLILIYSSVYKLYTELYTNHTKEQNLSICREIYGPRDGHKELNVREKQIPYINTYMWNLKKSA